MIDTLRKQLEARNLSPMTITLYCDVAQMCLSRKDILEPLRNAKSPKRYDTIATVLKYLDPALAPLIAEIPRPHRKPAINPSYSRAEFQKAILAIRQCLPRGKREAVLVMMLSGLRVGDVFLLRKQDIQDGLQGEALIRQKGARLRRWRPSPDIFGEMQVLLEMRWTVLRDLFGKSYKPAYDHLRTVIAKAYRRAGLREINPHAFRHAFAIFLYESGRPLNLISELLGHKSLAITMKYINGSSTELLDEGTRQVTSTFLGK